jgi:hypothetical protein
VVKRIGSTAWRVTVSGDGDLFSLGVRGELGREYEIMLGTVDSTPILTELLSDMAEAHRARPPRAFAPGTGPLHPKSRTLRPLRTRVERREGRTCLVLDFGGTVLTVEVDPDALKQDLDRLAGEA